MTAILGISAFYHDSAAALVVDGQLIAAAQEERFTRKKHDESFPTNAVRYCLREGGLTESQIDFVAFYDKPLLKLERLMETYFAFSPKGFRFFAQSMPHWMREKLFLRRRLRNALPKARNATFLFLEHHESHAASAFFPSPFKEAAIVTMDGVGEWATTSIGRGFQNRMEITHQMEFPHSLGLLYSAFTAYCGFKVNSGEYKLMGLAPYGKPRYLEVILKELLHLQADGSFQMDLDYFGYGTGSKMIGPKFCNLFGHAPRKPEEPLESFHADIAASIQAVTEIVVLHIARFAFEQTKCPNLVLAGGVALNCVANGRLVREGPFEKIWIQPAAGDAGGALGAAMMAWYQLLENPRDSDGSDTQQGSLLGPAFSDLEIQKVLQRLDIPHSTIAEEEKLVRAVSALLAEQKVIGWFQGRMEFGPRALGARSILGDPRSETMQSTLNKKIKYRETFRPFAPSVLKEQATNWFEMEPDQESPYMLTVAGVREGRRSIPAVTHVDASARVQTVDGKTNPRFHRLLKAFYEFTECPVLINTSFNIRGEPPVCTPEDALRCFAGTEMDVLVLGNHLIYSSAKERILEQKDRPRYIDAFELD